MAHTTFTRAGMLACSLAVLAALAGCNKVASSAVDAMNAPPSADQQARNAESQRQAWGDVHATAQAEYKRMAQEKAQADANRTPFETCTETYVMRHANSAAGTMDAEAWAACGNLHGASLGAIKQYEYRVHPLTMAATGNCYDDDPWTRSQDKTGRRQKLWEACMTVQAINDQLAQAGFEADQAKMASEQAMGRKPGEDPNQVIPGLEFTK